MSTVDVWARGGLAAAGTITFGGFAEIHLLLALVMVGMWCWYALTYPPPRVAGLYIIGTVAALLVRAAVT